VTDSNDNLEIFPLTLSCTACFKEFTPKQPDHTWHCASIILAPKAVESCSKAQ